MAYGLEDTGFVDKPVEDIISDLETAQKATIDAALDTSTTSPLGQINGIIAAALRELWEVAQAVHSAFDPDAASGSSLTSLASLTGTVRRAATKSTVTGRLNIDAGKTVPAGSVASVSGNSSARFVTLAAATNSGGAPANFDVDMEAETAGAVVANTGTLTVIETPVSGWNTITNTADATIGQAEETDGELRTRREAELRSTGAGAVNALRADLLALTGVTAAFVYENPGSTTDGDGVPAKAIEAVVLGGTAQEILDQIFETKPAGTQVYGNTSGTVTDSQGTDHTMYYTIPSEIDVHLDIEVETNTDAALGAVYPADGDTQIKTAISTWCQTNLSVGDDFIYTQMYSLIYGISGVTNVNHIYVDTAGAPTVAQDVAIGTREISNVDTANIDITAV